LYAGPAGGHEKDFAVMAGLLEGNINPSGPYIIMLWTRFPEQAEHLEAFLKDRLRGVPKPFAVYSLDKAHHLDDASGNVRDSESLITTIRELLGSQPQIAALFNWEDRVLGAAARTVGAITELAESEREPAKERQILDGVLCALATAAVGKAHVETDRFRAVNTALLPILADRIAAMTLRAEDTEVWQSGFTPEPEREVTVAEAAALNTMLHFGFLGDAGGAADPGAVIRMLGDHGGADYQDMFGMEATAAAKQFRCSDYVERDDRFRWVLIQIEAPCDHAQQKPGPLPYALGLEMPWQSLSNNPKPEALWVAPVFIISGGTRCLAVHSRFLITLARARIAGVQPEYRIRDQLLSQLIFKIHSHGMRPGAIAFEERKPGKRPQAAPAGDPELGAQSNVLREILDAVVRIVRARWRAR
jgi:hypothetical protein